jgi:hypothetical protein
MVATCLPGLPLEAVALAPQLLDNVPQAGEVVFRRLEPQFRFVPAAVETCDPCGILEDTAALFRLGIDDLADLALTDEGWRPRPCRGILEQDLHIARPCFAAVDPVAGTQFPLDPTRYLDNVAVVEFGRRDTIGVVDRDRDFSAVARGPRLRARKNHIIHG